mgnify:CR=1 FL=1
MRKYSTEDKLAIVEGYLNGEFSFRSKAIELGYSDTPGCFWRWLSIYKAQGAEGLISTGKHHTYTKELKLNAVEAYLNGEGSLAEIIAKYDISTESILTKWVTLSNTNKELTDYDPKREVYMAAARRKTTLEERKEIAEYCIAHNRDYKGTASIYQVSYSQVYSWVKKYDALGENGLVDKRGHRRTDEEVDELERLRRENLRLKRQLEERDMVVELLKKVQEFERM